MKLPFNIETIAQQVTVRSAVNPSLWACAVISVPLFSFASYTDNALFRFIFCIIGLIPVILFSISYLYFMFTNPNFLRSEDFQLKAESLKLLGDKDNPLQAEASDIVAINNPSLPLLKKTKTDE